MLILTNWEHTPYLARNFHSFYVQKLASIPYISPTATKHETHKHKLNIYLVANEKALILLSHTHLVSTLRDTLINGLSGTNLKTISLSLTKKDSLHLDSRHAYTDPYPP
jgi:hypothetical protein